MNIYELILYIHVYICDFATSVYKGLLGKMLSISIVPIVLALLQSFLNLKVTKRECSSIIIACIDDGNSLTDLRRYTVTCMLCKKDSGMRPL